MRIRPTVSVAFVVLLVLAASQCRKNNTSTEGTLEELPKDIAVNLKRVPNTDLLISEPRFEPKKTPVAEAPPIVLPKKKECMITETIFSQVFYQVTICSPRRNFGDVLSAYTEATSPLPPATVSPQARTFKLSSFEGKTLSSLLFCRQTSGPFYAQINKTTDCDDHSRCIMVILSVPACPACPTFVWDGPTCEVSNRPPQVQFVGPLLTGGFSSSQCPGSKSDCGSGVGTSPTPIPTIHPAVR